MSTDMDKCRHIVTFTMDLRGGFFPLDTNGWRRNEPLYGGACLGIADCNVCGGGNGAGVLVNPISCLMRPYLGHFGKSMWYNHDGEIIMSTTRDIWEVYRDDINEKSRLVYLKNGALPFYEGVFGFMDLRTKSFYENLDQTCYWEGIREIE